jgi:quercetin dioxygenase-like cupin family protein
MEKLIAGVTPASEGLDGIAWDILGQTYVPKLLSEHAFLWHATFPADTFVPPHFHPTQDEWIYMLEGEFDLMLDGKEMKARAGDMVRMPMAIPHGIFNRSGRTVTCVFGVAPTRKLFDLFQSIHKKTDVAEIVRLSGEHEVEFLPPPSE